MVANTDAFHGSFGAFWCDCGQVQDLRRRHRVPVKTTPTSYTWHPRIPTAEPAAAPLGRPPRTGAVQALSRLGAIEVLEPPSSLLASGPGLLYNGKQ